MLLDEHTKCSACGEAASNKCTACQTHVYCGKDCQIKDWPEHKKICKHVRQEMIVERAGNLLKELYLDLREKTFDNHIVQVNAKNPKELIIYDGNLKDRVGWFQKFPNHLVEKGSIKNGVLSTLTCNEPLALMKGAVEKLFKGDHWKTTEVEVALNPPPRVSIIYLPDKVEPQTNWPSYGHNLLHLHSVHSKRKWVVDLTGDQYGIPQAVWTWSDYKSRYVAKIDCVGPLGSSEEILQKSSKINGYPSVSCGAALEAASRFQEGIKSWEKVNDLTLCELVKLPGQKFKDKRRELLNTMGIFMAQYVENVEAAYAAKYRDVSMYETENPGVSLIQQMGLSKEFSNGK
ncbi:hypothetical protein DM02DRAFT_690044 [Periconia macrospinosa]|uniref:MYND-type domain-containing protein n=1 Tax=Periconia macrospinosa TaxID=97972 RepID=A0A2V1DBL1_9PLEO|nr:hypothetical protein DM02DRAFT_690044 [Periconia macrospinosa]